MAGLLINTQRRALYVRNRKLVLATPACRQACCGAGCSTYAELRPCPSPLPPNGPPDCVYTPPVVYACSTTLCSGGGAAFPPASGRLFHVDRTGVCYRFNQFVPASQVPPAGPGVRILPAGSTVVCYGPPEGNPVACTDPICRFPGEFFEAIPCPGLRLGSNPTRVFICAAIVHGCSVASFGHRDLDGRLICYKIGPGRLFSVQEIPFGSDVIVNGYFGDGPVRTCCECAEGCNRVALAETACLRISDPPPAQPAYPRQCCCDGDDQFHVTRYSFRYNFVRVGGFIDGRLIDSGYATPNNLAYFRYRFTSQFENTIITQLIPTVCGFNIDSPIGYFPGPGATFGDPWCQPYADENQRVHIQSVTYVHRCDYLSFHLDFSVDVNVGGGQFVESVVGFMDMGIRRIPNPNTRCSGGCEKVVAPFGTQPSGPIENPGDIGGAPPGSGTPIGGGVILPSTSAGGVGGVGGCGGCGAGFGGPVS